MVDSTGTYERERVAAARGETAFSGLRLLVLIDRYRPILGGAQNNIHELGRRLSAKGFHVTVLTRRIYGETAAVEVDEGITVRRIAHFPNRLVSKLMCIVSVITHLVKHRTDYDLVMCVPCTKLTDLLPMLVAAPLSGLPYIIRATGMVDNFDYVLAWRMDSLSGFLNSLLIPPFVWRHIYTGSRTVVVQSQALLDRAMRYGLDCQLIPNGADTDRFRSSTPEERRELRASLGIPDDRVIVISTGRFSQSKNQITLIQAAERVERELAPGRMRLLVLGATERNQVTSNHEQLEAYVAEHGLGDVVSLFCDVRNVDDYLRASDVYSIPSNSDEGMSNALVEAMACGLPVVSSSIPQNVAVLPPEGALFFDPLDLDRLAAHLTAIASSESQRSAMGAANAAHVDANYANHELAERYVELLERLARGGPPVG